MLRTVDLDLGIGTRRLVTGLQWTVSPGECWCVIGPNGVGKSTLLRALTGLREPDRGHVELDGRALRDWPVEDLARRRAYLSQSRSDAFGYTALDAVLTARHPYHHAHYWESDADHRAAREALDMLQAGHLASQDVRTLSGGE